MNEYLANADELAAGFGVDPSAGLDDDRVRENAAKYGVNVLAGTKPVSLIHGGVVACRPIRSDGR